MEMSTEIERTSLILDAELRKQESVSQAVTQAMIDDAIELLQLFGVPYVLSPSEAEAQCAKLEELNLSDGTITDDSDVWLFGGNFVLKNFFQQGKYVLSYRRSDIHRLFGLDRDKMISLALVCGSDYTDGIPGAGPITAMEILSEFSSDSGVAALSQFKHWADSVKANKGFVPTSGNTKIKTKLKKLVTLLPDAFPNRVVVDAYLKPHVDESKEAFDWIKPDLDLLRGFAHRKLSWPSQKVDDLVCPVLKRLNDTEAQAKISKFFSVSGSSSINASAEFHSKRLKSAISKLLDSKPEETTAVSLNKLSSQTSKVTVNQASKSRLSQGKKTNVRNKAASSKSSDNCKKASRYDRPVANKLRQIKDELNLSEESSESN